MADKNPTPEQITAWKKKAEKWDKLEQEIGEYYALDEDGEEKEDDIGSLIDIGEKAASAFGYL